METPQTILELMTKDYFMANIDIKDAFHAIRVDVNFQKFLKFEFEGCLYCFTCFPNELGPCPRKFTKTLKPPLADLRDKGHISSAYIDDIYLQGSTYHKCVINVIDTTISLDSLSFTVHPIKTQFLSKQLIACLGFILSSREMSVRLTDEKTKKVASACDYLLHTIVYTIREVATVLGILVLSFPGVMHGPLHYRGLEHNKKIALKMNRGDYDRTMSLSSSAKDEQKWWVQNVQTAYNLISHGSPNHVLYTDASSTGWGAVFEQSYTSGHWTSLELLHHINYLELFTVCLGLLSFFKHKQNVHIRLTIDNTTAFQCINNMETSRSPLCNFMTQKIWDFAARHVIWLSAAHIPGRLNTESDILSREKQVVSDRMLRKDVFEHAISTFNFKPDIDLFASRVNHQLKSDVSSKPDPEGITIDAFSLNWSKYSFLCLSSL